ncbi:hypothetical protein [Borreliella garinii]|uniref:hypothetical protein n=1 Tax=Borreliella garinii TaxID=29519 RepID=UPI001AEE834F|nr:hypothetical protein [Borreliella garinii]
MKYNNYNRIDLLKQVYCYYYQNKSFLEYYFYIDKFKTLYEKLESFKDSRKNYLTSIVNFQIAYLVQSVNVKNSSDSYSTLLSVKSVLLDFISSQSFKDCHKSIRSDTYRLEKKFKR